MKRLKNDAEKFNWTWFNDFLKAASKASSWPEFKMNTLMDGTSERWLSEEGKKIMNAFIECKCAGDYKCLFSVDENIDFACIGKFLFLASQRITWLNDYLAELNS